MSYDSDTSDYSTKYLNLINVEKIRTWARQFREWRWFKVCCGCLSCFGISILVISAILIAAGTRYMGYCSPIPPVSLNFSKSTDTLHFEYNYSRSSPLNYFQWGGTHNSYHIQKPGSAIKNHMYSHETIDLQLERGWRQIELDLHFRWNSMLVFHVQLIDDLSSCYCLVSCLSLIKEWSDKNLNHSPIYVFLEFKEHWYEDITIGVTGMTPTHITTLENEVLSVFDRRDQLVFPRDIVGNYSSLREAIVQRGWPTLEDTQGKIFLILHSDKARAIFSQLYPNNDGIFFTRAREDEEDPNVIFYGIDDPTSPMVKQRVTEGFIVRSLVNEAANSDSENKFSTSTGLQNGVHMNIIDFDSDFIELVNTTLRCGTLHTGNCTPEELCC